MTLETLQKEMVKAMKEKEKVRKAVFSNLVAAVKKTAIDKKCKDNISEELVNHEKNDIGFISIVMFDANNGSRKSRSY